MAIKFGSDGTLYCNTIKYNYKQARNMIADGSYGNMSGNSVWGMLNVSIVNSTPGYKTYRCFSFNSGAYGVLLQPVPLTDSSHKYYFSFYCKTDRQVTINLFSKYSSIIFESTNNNWVKFSYIYSGALDSQLSIISSDEGYLYLCKFILIDLTDTFGAGYEPTKEWCDSNIREHEVYKNFGNISNNISSSEVATKYTTVQLDRYNYNYLELDSNWEPRDYMIGLVGVDGCIEGFLYSTSGFQLVNTNTYYFQIETLGYERTQSCDLYFPEAEPPLGRTPLVRNTDYNGGGGMREWKRVSMFGKRESFNNGSYTMRFDFNNEGMTNWLRTTGLILVNVASQINQYNSYNGTSIKINDVNKEWCDRWVDGRSSPIIHIKDPNNTNIKFNTDYDIVCNDIEIRPEVNKIILRNDGTIVCKKLVKTQDY